MNRSRWGLRLARPRKRNQTFTAWALAISAVAVLAGCTSPEEAALELYDAASARRDAGQLAESDRLLEQLRLEFPETAVAGRADELLETVRSESETAALELVDEIRQAQEAFIARERRYAQSVEELVARLVLQSAPDDRAIGYRIRTRSSPAADAYSIRAEAVVGVSGRRSFFQDREGAMHQALGQEATAESPLLE
jgi:UTP:GlnB (protein PII) uridylyltransferase